ncbi:MAG: hypothetical protein AAF515_07635 [Pseudomonadota bacterium]
MSANDWLQHPETRAAAERCVDLLRNIRLDIELTHPEFPRLLECYAELTGSFELGEARKAFEASRLASAWAAVPGRVSASVLETA